MSWRDTIRTATEAVRTHRLRSALTMLGILIGITAVVLTVGLGQGAQAKVRDQINELGTNLLVVSPGSSTSSSGVPRRIRFGVHAHRAGCKRPRVEDGRAGHPDGGPGLDDQRVARERLDELDDDPDRHHAQLEDRSVPRCVVRTVHLGEGREGWCWRRGARFGHR